MESVRAAADVLRAQAGVARLSLFGVRFGAMAAALAVAGRDDVESLIAWAPPRSGSAYVRELRAYRMIRAPHAPVERRTDGAEEVVGYLFTAGTLAQLEPLTYASIARPRRALVLPRLRTPVDETALIEALRTQEIPVRIGEDSGYARMMRDPYSSEPPESTLDAIVDWLAQAAAPQEERAQVHAPAAAGVGGAQQAGPRPAEAVLDLPGVRETAHRFGGGERLFGVVSMPTTLPYRERPALLLLNVGADQHIGPHRMYVELAREAASRGYLTLRFDIGGLGESAPAPGRPENKLYDIRSIDDVIAALELLESRWGARRFVLAGLCSGAFLAYQAALRDPRVVGQLLMNTFAFEWKEGDPVEPGSRKVTARFGSARHYARALFDREVWARAVRGQNRLGRGGRVRVRLCAAPRRRGGLPPARAPAGRAAEALVGRAGLRRALRSRRRVVADLGIRRRRPRHDRSLPRSRCVADARPANFSLEVLENIDHTFTPISARARLRDSIFRYLASRFP